MTFIWYPRKPRISRSTPSCRREGKSSSHVLSCRPKSQVWAIRCLESSRASPGRGLLTRTFTVFYVRPKRREQQSGTGQPLEVRACVCGISPTPTPKPIFPFLEIELLFAALFPFFCDTIYVLSRARHWPLFYHSYIHSKIRASLLGKCSPQRVLTLLRSCS